MSSMSKIRVSMGTRKSVFGVVAAALIALGASCCALAEDAAIPIASIEDLQKIGNDVAFPSSGHYILTQNLDAIATADWNYGDGFSPIYDFQGVFDGQEHIITNLHSNGPLFYATRADSQILRLGLENCLISGGSYSSPFIGTSYGLLEECYATGLVRAKGGYGAPASGLVGTNNGTIRRCYSTVAVEGAAYTVYGLCGSGGGPISECYFAGALRHPTPMGLSHVDSENSFFAGELSAPSLEEPHSLPNAQFVTSAPFVAAGWDYSNVWTQEEGVTLPHFAWAAGTDEFILSVEADHAAVAVSPTGATYPKWSLVSMEVTADSGYSLLNWYNESYGLYPSDYFTTRQIPVATVMTDDTTIIVEADAAIPISTIEDLQKIGRSMAYPSTGYYVLTQNLDATATAAWNYGIGFIELPSIAGVFDGQGHVISNIHLAGSGFISGVTSSGELRRLGVENALMRNDTYGYALVFSNQGIIKQCYSSSVSPSGSGLVQNNYGLITQCFVVGASAASGIAGASTGVISECFVAGSTGFEGSEASNITAGGRIERSFAATDFTLGLPYPIGQYAISTAALLDSATFRNAGWDYADDDGTPAVWTQTDGETVPHFAGWEGDDERFTVQATAENGTASVAPVLADYAKWSVVTLAASANSQYALEGWTGVPFTDHAQDSPRREVLPLVVCGDIQIKAEFVRQIPINSVEDLSRIGQENAYPLNGNYVLTHDLNAFAYTDWIYQQGFGRIYDSFSGTLDGAGHTISWFSNEGMFTLTTKRALIKDLTLEWGLVNDNDMWDPESHLVRFNSGVIVRCKINGVLSTDSTAGAVAAENYGLVLECGATGLLSSSVILSNYPYGSNGYMGLLVGRNLGLIADSWADGSISVPSPHTQSNPDSNTCRVGGLVGANSGVVTRSWATVNATTDSTYLGGLVGENSGLVDQSFADAVLSTQIGDSGGLVGVNDGTIQRCYAAGAIYASVYAGGLVGRNSELVSECYAVAEVHGGVAAGGLVGVLSDEPDAIVETSFWDTQTTLQLNSPGGGEGLVTSEMTSAAPFLAAGWDFANVWGIEEGKSYPYLLALDTGEPVEGQPVEGQPAEGEVLEGEVIEGQPAEGQPAEGAPAEGQVIEGQPVEEGQPAEGAPVEGQIIEGQPAEGHAPEGESDEEGEEDEGEDDEDHEGAAPEGAGPGTNNTTTGCFGG